MLTVLLRKGMTSIQQHYHIFLTKLITSCLNLIFCEILKNSNMKLLVTKQNEEIVGFAVLEINESPRFESMAPRKFVYVNDFWIKAAYHRQGIGKILFQACVEWARNKVWNLWNYEMAISFIRVIEWKRLVEKCLFDYRSFKGFKFNKI